MNHPESEGVFFSDDPDLSNRIHEYKQMLISFFSSKEITPSDAFSAMIEVIYMMTKGSQRTREDWCLLLDKCKELWDEREILSKASGLWKPPESR